MEIKNNRTSINIDGHEVMATVCRIADEQTSFLPHDHTLVHVAKGSLELILDGAPIMTVGEGECVFVRKDHRLKIRRRIDNNIGFHLSIFIYFGQKFLFDAYHDRAAEMCTERCGKGSPMLKMEKTPAVASLFESFRPFYYSREQPDHEWLESKLYEGLRIVLNTHPEARMSLFNFASPFRPDLLDFMEEYYLYDLSLEEIALATGRSLATFKRDFAKVSSLSPKKWIMERRLQHAHNLLKTTHLPIGEIMTESGFKNFSHFSRAYHQKYGVTPSETLKGVIDQSKGSN